MSATTSRRRFLQAAALTAASLPMLRGSVARAGNPVAPLRLILLWSPFHNPQPFYHPQVSASDSSLAPAGTNFYLGFQNSILAPLAPFQSDLIIVRGLGYGTKPGSHASGPEVFTGSTVSGTTSAATMDPAASSTASSIDQYLHGRMAQASSQSPFFGGFFSYLYSDHCYDSDICFSGGNPVPMVSNPQALYNQLFSGFTPPSSTGPSQAQLSQASRRQQTLGLVQKYLTSYQNQLPTSSVSTTVLQSHLSAAQALSAQIGASLVPSTVACTPPGASAIFNDPNPDNGSYVAADAPKDMASFIQTIALALACDITRFGALKMSAEEDPSQALVNLMPGLTNFSGNWHGDVTHNTTGEASNSYDVQMAQFKNYFMTQVASLLAALKSYADPYAPGQTLYDNTVVLIGSEGPVQSVGTDLHGNGTNDFPFVIAGGCGRYFKMGQFMLAGGSTAPSVNHNLLLTNIINTFETNQQQFNPSYTPNIINQFGDFGFSQSPTDWLST